MTKIFPCILIALDLGAAVVYGISGDWRKMVYWTAAVVPKEVKTFDYQRILNRNGLYPFLKARVVSMRINARQKLLKLAVFATYDEKVYYQDYYQDITDYTRTEQEYGKFTYPFSVIGKTVFLTREEAERALKEAEK